MQLKPDPLGGKSLSHFEYIAAAHTLILTFAAARLLGGVPHAVRRDRASLIHISWLFMAVLWCLASFWAFWEYRDVSWTLPRLVLLLSTPALIYVFSSIVVPADPASVPSWREYFLGVRVPLFGAAALLVVSILLSNQILLGVHALHYTQLQLYGILAAVLAGAAVSSARFQAMFALLPWASGVAILLGNFGDPNWVSP